MAHRSQCSSAGDNPLDPNYLPPHYREEYRLAIDALIEEELEGYYQFLQKADVVDFLASSEIEYISSSVQVPQQSNNPEQYYQEDEGDGSSDTYWPIHSDLDVPGLDLGWPQMHHFIGPTEVTTLVNPPEPDMPSIKEQARRLIKNARQVIAIVMDMFTDVDILADILNAAMRNVAVYVLLDKQNAHHFINMVSNCRVDLQSIQLLRVRTVSGIKYHCRSGSTFTGQMMDRFLLTDCRAVLSGNYSFMWSFEKLHRCMAHLFLGQLVTTFDEEFRILFAQSQPLIIENLAPMEELSLSQKRQYPTERTMYRETKKFQSLDTGHPDDGLRHPYSERMDLRMMALKKQESLQGPADMHSRFTPQHPRMDPSMMENPAFKRHSYAEGSHGRYSLPFLQQQGMPESEKLGRQFYRGQQPGPAPGREADTGANEKFWNQDFYSADPNIEPGLPPEVEPGDNFDPVLNYLTSTRIAEFDKGSEELQPVADFPFGSSHPRRSSLGNQQAFQASPTPSNPTDQKQSFQEPITDRKDPLVKRGLRNWRISSFLSAHDNPEEEGLPSAPLNAQDPFEVPSNPIQQTAGIDLALPKMPNYREFRVPAIPRASQMPSFVTTRQPRKLPDENTAVAAEIKTTPTPSESSSSTTEVEKLEDVEQKEPKMSGLRREESFRRKYNAAIPRSSRLRSSMIFSSLDQKNTAPGDQQDEEGDKDEAEQTKLPFVSQVMGQRRTAREPFEWSRYMKSATFENSATDQSKPDDGNSKPDNKDSPKDTNSEDLSEAQNTLKQPSVEQADSSPSVPQSKASETELPKTDQPVEPPKPLLTAPLYVDMSDPDNRLMFFKELAAKRKAANSADAEKSKEKAPMKSPIELKSNTAVEKEKPVPKETSEKTADASISKGSLDKNANAKDAGKPVSTEAFKAASLSLDASKSCKQEQTRVPTDLEKIELSNNQTKATVSAETSKPQSQSPEEPKLSNPAVKTSSSSHPPTPTNATPASVQSLAQGTDKSKSPCLDSTSKESSSPTPSSEKVPPSSGLAVLDSNTPSHESLQLETSISGQSSSSEQIMPVTGSQISPSPSSSSRAISSTSSESISSSVTQKDSSSTVTPSILSPNAQESVSPSLPAHSHLTSPDTISATDSAHVESDISPDTCAAGSEPNKPSLQSHTMTDSEESSAPTPSEKDILASLSPSLPETCLPNVSDLESQSKSAQNETNTASPTQAVPLPNHYPVETSSPVNPDSTTDASQSERQATPPSKLNVTSSVTPTPPETESSSIPSSLSPETETTKGVGKESKVLGSSEDVKADSKLASPSLPEICHVPDLKSNPSEPPVPAKHMDSQNEARKETEKTDPVAKKTGDTKATNKVNKTSTRESVGNEKTNERVSQNNCSGTPEITPDVPSSPQSKQPKSSQSRFQSSTANVISSSNLRDDTKLLLGQISANSQSRNEAAKEAPVTDDEKEDKADRNAKREKEIGIRSLSRGQPKSIEERDKLLEKITHMRKERKVYSRFEMAP
ncbi:protein FAM83H-like [Notothenia coriiceps]|uniref:Protein FAM83H-like n=1 Tax=Notothenia coriiceps TaxID=8208 RepID=A0A6I9MBP7_9TELE|nr:PREDICTED: protein FAM83H-like [Notothenia coriiceps]